MTNIDPSREVSAGTDEWFVPRHARVSDLIERTRSLTAAHSDDLNSLLGSLEAPFRELLADPTWLPEVYAATCESGGMGGGIGQWLLFRSGDQSLTLFSLVVPPGSATPVHDHHAWGLVGLYRGEQSEDVYQRETAMPAPDGRAPLSLVEQRLVRPGEVYRLVPPVDDVHSVRTISAEPSISIHLLGIDAGCVWRHRFDPEHAHATVFRSGYTNLACPDETAEPPDRIVCA